RRPAAERAGIACTVALVGYTAFENVVKPVYENRQAAFQELFVGEKAESQTFYTHEGENEMAQNEKTTTTLTAEQEKILSLIGERDGLRNLLRDQLRELNKE